MVDTLVILMAARTLPHIARELVAHGRSPDTPVAVARLIAADATTITTTLGEVRDGFALETIGPRLDRPDRRYVAARRCLTSEGVAP